MKDTSLYQQILGDTNPWNVSEVLLDAEKLTVEVRLTVRPDALWGCPQCQSRMHIKEWRTRRWRHLDSCQFKTILEAAVPVVECSEPGAQTVSPVDAGSESVEVLVPATNRLFLKLEVNHE